MNSSLQTCRRPEQEEHGEDQLTPTRTLRGGGGGARLFLFLHCFCICALPANCVMMRVNSMREQTVAWRKQQASEGHGKTDCESDQKNGNHRRK